jgi:hypothetical protein
MFNKTGIALSVMIVLGTASGAFAKNQGTIYTDPDSTPNGPFFYVERYGAPPFYVERYGAPPTVWRPVHLPRRHVRDHLALRPN